MPSVSSTIAQAVGNNLTSALVRNISLPIANTEITITLNASTKMFVLQNRDVGLLKLSYALGQSGTAYFTIWPGNKYSVSNLSGSSAISLYIQSPKGLQTLELEEWQ